MFWGKQDVRQERAQPAPPGTEADQGLEHREGWPAELARVSSNLAGNAGLPPSEIAEAHRKAGVTKIHHWHPYSTEQGGDLGMVWEGSAL